MPAIPLTWLNQFTVNTTTTGTQSDPDIVQLANGNILVTWTSSDNGGPGSPPGTEIIGQMFTPMGVRIGAEFRLNNASTSDNERNADLAALPGGGFVMVYHDVDLDGLGGSNIRLEEYDAAGNAVTASTVVVADSGAPGPPNYGNPRVAVSSATSVLIVYEQGTWSQVVGKIYNPVTDTYSAPFDIFNVFNGNNDPDVTVLSNGNYVVTASLTGPPDPPHAFDSSIVLRIYTPAGAPVTTIFGPANGPDQADVDPSVTALAGGGFVVAWTNTDANDTDVKFTIFNAAGVETGSGSGVAGATNNNNEPVVAGLSDGSFVIVYDNDEFNRMDVEHFNAAGLSIGIVSFAGIGAAPAVTDLGDGRFAVTWQEGSGEIAMEILDTRDFVNANPVYVPDSWQVGTVNDDVFTTATSAEIVHGHDGDDIITEAGSGTVGGDPVVRIFGDGGDDTIIVTSNISGDVFNGGGGANPDGNDTIDWSAATITGSGYYFDLEAGLAIDSPSFVDEIKNFQNLIGTNQADTIVGNEGANIIDARGGDDVVRGRGNGDDLQGGAGIDTLSYEFAPDAVAVNLLTGLGTLGEAAGDTVSGFENIKGGDFADTLTGDGQSNRLDGGAGFDTLTGGANNDTYIVDTQSDVLSETAAAGIDIVETSLANYSLFFVANVERILFTGTGNFVGRGNGLDNRIEGGVGDDRFVVDQGGADRYFGGLGAADTVDYRLSATGAVVNLTTGIHAGAAAGDFFSSIEYFYGSNTAGDIFTGGAFNDRFDGYGGADVLSGLGGTDTLNGGDGDDEISGGTLLDFLSGNAGADDFNYAAVSESGPTSGARDRILDFQAGGDDIDVSAIDADTSTGANDAFTAYIGAATFTAAGQIRAFQSGANTVIEFNTTGASGAEMQIQLNNFTATTLTVGDLIL